MCGIAGIYSAGTKVEISKLQKMGDILAHRGPDGQGMWVDEENNLGFMHRRLSIIDLSETGKQPMHYLEKYTITFNGEIYNYIELKKELIEKGYSFASQSDTEVLLALYADQGYDCVKKVDGMFAFAIWDHVKKEMFLARDRFGEKPLYYAFIDGAFCFASEMKALFEIGASKKTLPDRIYKYLQSNVLNDKDDIESTIYEQIRQIDAADYMVVKDALIRKKHKYWNLDHVIVNNKITIEDAADEFRRLFTGSIKRRMRSDVPVGSSLSGGIDSSAVVLIANQLKGDAQIQNTFSARFKNFKKDEGAFIEMIVNKSPEINPHYVWPEIEMLVNEIETLAYHQEEPFYSGSQYNQFCVMRLAKEYNTTVLLDGQGADEQLGGYMQYYIHHLTYNLTHSPLKFLSERKKYSQIHKELVPYRIPRRLPLWYIQKLLFKKKFYFDDDARTLLKRDTTQTFLKELLRYGDRNSMAFSREVRLPFLSHELSEFIFSLPMEFILNEGWTKYILRKAVEGIVPDEIVWRKDKIGFEPPQENWVERLKPIIDGYKAKKNYLDFTGGKTVKHITDWKWLMLKLFVSE